MCSVSIGSFILSLSDYIIQLPRPTTTHDTNGQPRDCNAPAMHQSARRFGPEARDSGCAQAVLRFTVAKRPQTAPAITLNLVHCVFTTPHHQPAKRARIPKIARSPRKPSATISNPRQLGVARDLHAFYARGTCPDAPRHRIHTFSTPSPWHHVCGFPRVPESLVQFPTPRLAGRLTARPTRLYLVSNDIRRASTTCIHSLRPNPSLRNALFIEP